MLSRKIILFIIQRIISLIQLIILMNFVVSLILAILAGLAVPSISGDLTIFSDKSQLTMVTSSCGRLDLLSSTLYSFFNCNTYPLRKLIIIDDCSSNPKDIMDAIPDQVSEYESYIQIHINTQKMGIVGNVNQGMKRVKTKYVIWSEDDWFYHFRRNFIEDSIELLEQSQEIGFNIVQSIIGRTRKAIYKLDLEFSPKGIGFYKTKRVIGFNPSIINHEAIFYDIFHGDILATIRQKYCPEDPDTMSDDCLKQKYYRSIIRETNSDIIGVMLYGDVKERQSAHLGGGRHVGLKNAQSKKKGELSIGKINGNPLNVNALILHQQKQNKLYYWGKEQQIKTNPIKQKLNEQSKQQQHQKNNKQHQQHQQQDKNKTQERNLCSLFLLLVIFTLFLGLIMIFSCFLMKKGWFRKYLKLPKEQFKGILERHITPSLSQSVQ